MNEQARLFMNRIRHLGYMALPWVSDIDIYCKKYDLHFRSHKRDGIGKDIAYKYGVYAEDYVTAYLYKKMNLRKGGIMLDIGANIGWFSLVLARQCGLRVYAFEPHPFNFSMLSKNISANHLDSIRAFPKAVGDRNGRMQLHIYKSYNMGRHSLIDHGKTGLTHEVETISIDGFMREQGLENEPLELIKIDIEGYEMAALRGAADTLRRTRLVFSEFSPSIMKGIGESAGAYVDLMTGLGFNPYIIRDEYSAGAVSADALRKYDEGVHNIFWSREPVS